MLIIGFFLFMRLVFYSRRALEVKQLLRSVILILTALQFSAIVGAHRKKTGRQACNRLPAHGTKFQPFKGDNSMPSRKHTTKPSRTPKFKIIQGPADRAAMRFLEALEEKHARGRKSVSASSALTWRGKRNQVPRLTNDRTRDLVRDIFNHGDDQRAAALVELVTGIAYEAEAIDRDSLALMATHESFTLTDEFSDRAESFATRACMRTALRATLKTAKAAGHN